MEGNLQIILNFINEQGWIILGKIKTNHERRAWEILAKLYKLRCTCTWRSSFNS